MQSFGNSLPVDLWKFNMWILSSSVLSGVAIEFYGIVLVHGVKIFKAGSTSPIQPTLHVWMPKSTESMLKYPLFLCSFKKWKSLLDRKFNLVLSGDKMSLPASSSCKIIGVKRPMHSQKSFQESFNSRFNELYHSHLIKCRNFDIGFGSPKTQPWDFCPFSGTSMCIDELP